MAIMDMQNNISKSFNRYKMHELLQEVLINVILHSADLLHKENLEVQDAVSKMYSRVESLDQSQVISRIIWE